MSYQMIFGKLQDKQTKKVTIIEGNVRAQRSRRNQGNGPGQPPIVRNENRWHQYMFSVKSPMGKKSISGQITGILERFPKQN